MLPVLVIFFRESLEATLIVGIIVAYLHRIGRPDQARPVWLGVGLAVALDLGVALATYHLIHQYDGSRLQTALEGSTYFVATAMLTGMSFWMQRQSRDLRRALESQVADALGRGSLWALVGLSALTVGREGLETVFFTLAIVLSSSLSLGALLAGAALGLAMGLGTCYAVYRLGRRLPLGLFFQVLGLLLLVFAAALLAGGIEDFQALGWIPFGTQVLWHTGRVLSENSLLGDLLHNFVGYADAPTALQFGAWATFLLVTLTRWARGQRRPRPALGRANAPGA
ncbi:MAG: FTR1 family protein [Firmicutes bacterium]|nr:FTR1 family protein [Alicyclobacillaceae bacterium]MCL6496294.1 FTR1 family protein [Bacillota bacterium]